MSIISSIIADLLTLFINIVFLAVIMLTIIYVSKKIKQRNKERQEQEKEKRREYEEQLKYYKWEEKRKHDEYYKSTYYLATKNHYEDVLYDKGLQGEYRIFKKLNTLERYGARFLFNCYLPKNKNETTEIDVILLTTSGIFVFESKNYNGWIFGSEHQKFWMQTLKAGRNIYKTRFYNPIWQNNTHIKCLKRFIGSNIPYYSVIVFSNECKLQNIYASNPKTAVINLENLFYTVWKIIPRAQNALPIEQLIEIYDRLYPYTQVNEEVKRKHSEYIETME